MPAAYKGECGDEVDPMPFLVPTEKERMDAINRPYDSKRSCWVRDEKEAFVAAEIQSEDGDKVTVKTSRNTASLCLSACRSVCLSPYLSVYSVPVMQQQQH